MATTGISAPTRTTTLPVSALVIAKRTVLKFLRTPQLVLLGPIQGAMFLLIFRYVFGGAISVGGSATWISWSRDS
jgi:ABC-2 type transport system permease protein/oleandomycin transport system permease protein